MLKSIYLNIEDDVTKVSNKVKREKAPEVVLVFPKKSFVFSDSINLRLLKKQIDMLGKKAYILTMDEKGQMYAQEAGFELKFLPKTSRMGSISDIRPRRTIVSPQTPPAAISEPRPKPTLAPTMAPKPPLQKMARRTTPFVAPRIREDATPVETTENVFIPPQSKRLDVPARRSYKKFVIGFIALALVVILLLVLVILPSASITVFAKSQVVSRDIDILADVNAQSVDASKLTIPATAVNESQDLTDTFQTNGKKEVGSKSEGRVAIYNLTGSPINLKATTTAITVGSKTYYFKADQSGIKALTSATDDANASVADIVAAEGGESYNLPAGTRLEITNQAFGSQPQRLYAKTVSQVVGGSSRFISVITKEDITQAQDILTKKVVADINNKIKEQQMSLVDGAYTVNVTSFTTDKPEGTEAPTFAAQIQLTVTGLAFNESTLRDMVRQRLIMSLGASKSLQDPNADSIVYKIKNIDTANGVMQLSLHYESKAIPTIAMTELKNEIAGKSKSEASELILANPDVDRVEITVQPGWQSSLPRFSSKIQLEVKE